MNIKLFSRLMTDIKGDIAEPKVQANNVRREASKADVAYLRYFAWRKDQNTNSISER